jgi:hypothetical protein
MAEERPNCDAGIVRRPPLALSAGIRGSAGGSNGGRAKKKRGGRGEIEGVKGERLIMRAYLMSGPVLLECTEE